MAFSYRNDVSENFSVYKMADEVLRYAYGKPVLAIPDICPIVNTDRLHIRQPILGELKTNMGIKELESIGIQNPHGGHKDIELLNDRIAVSVSAESQIENYYGDSLAMIAKDQGQSLAKALELWIVKALQTTPLQISAIPPVAGADTAETCMNKAAQSWHLHAMPHAKQLLGTWEPTAVAMNGVTWSILQPTFNGAIAPGGSNVPYQWAEGIPGLDRCKIVQSPYLPVDKIYIISAEADAMRCYQYDMMQPVLQYDPVINADSMYTGIWRTVASNFRTAIKQPKWNPVTGALLPNDKQSGNAGVVEITIGGAFFGQRGALADEDAITTFIDQTNEVVSRNVDMTAGTYVNNQAHLRTPNLAATKESVNLKKPQKASKILDDIAANS